MRTGRTIWIGGLVAGALDILYAIIVYGMPPFGLAPQQVLQSVAAGWVGRTDSMAGGWPTALLGLATHFGIATCMAAAFVLAARRWPGLVARPVLWGLVYGFGLYVAMNYVVAPLSAAHASGHFPADSSEAFARLSEAFSAVRPKDNRPLLIGTLFTHMVLVGLPIALIARRELRRPA
ncbi:hypothetical protein [Sphingomonas sp.]|uniref:hypothetical protein n=1 Tax=Sphingomonas sp. TaxID=28214 RepID=UPI002DB888E7|nr:hypothetical protein [Sphingomonas sp.]HEU4967652.1 hypothetical protein [Sphingomonas sp.]